MIPTRSHVTDARPEAEPPLPVVVPGKRLERTTRVALIVLICVLLAAGVGCLLASLLPYSFAQAQLARFGGMRGSASVVFTETVFQGIIARARVGGGALIACAVVLAFSRRLVQAYVCATLADLPLLTSDLAARLRLFLGTERRLHLLGLGLVTLLGGLLRVAFLSQPIRYDEANTFLGSASVPLYIGLSKYLNNNNHLLNTLLTHISYLMFGDALWAIRLPAFVAGVLIIPAAYLVARTFYGKYVALLAAALVAGSSTLVEFSTNSRGYTLLCLIWLLALALAAYLLKTPRAAGFFVLGVLGALGFYAMPTMLYPFGIVMLWLLLMAVLPARWTPARPTIRDIAITVVVAGILTLVLYTPVFVVSGIGPVVANEALNPWRTSSSLEVFARLPGSLAVLWDMWNRDVPLPLQAALGLGFAASIVLGRRLGAAHVLLMIATAGWVLATLMAQKVVPYERVWLFLLPLYLGMAVAGIALLTRWLAPSLRRYAITLAPALAVATVLLMGGIGLRTQSVYYSEETGVLRDGEGITLFLRDRLQPGDRVVATETSEAPMYYYFRHYGIPFDYLVRQPSDAPAPQGRVYLIVNLSSNRFQTLDMPLQQVGWRLTPGTTPALLRQYDTATLYDLTPDQIQIEGSS